MTDLHVNSLSNKTQDYLKVIWDIEAHTGRSVQLRELAQRVGDKLSTASETVKRLAEKDFIIHQPYRGIVLSDLGQSIAIQMVRRHRLLESFLVDVLDYRWDEVHDEAEILEHAISDELLERIDVFLNRPERDPHGDPIPSADGSIDDPPTIILSETPPGTTVTIDRLSDKSPVALRYFDDKKLGLGDTLTVDSYDVDGLIFIRTKDKPIPFGINRELSDFVRVVVKDPA